MILTATGIMLWTLLAGLVIVGLLRKRSGHGAGENHHRPVASNKEHKHGCCG